MVSFTLYDVGILPAEATAQSGPVSVTLEDLTGGSSGLIVEREAGPARETVGQVARSPRSWRGRQEMTLQPGRYVVYDADHPDHSAVLTVEP